MLNHNHFINKFFAIFLITGLCLLAPVALTLAQPAWQGALNQSLDSLIAKLPRDQQPTLSFFEIFSSTGKRQRFSSRVEDLVDAYLFNTDIPSISGVRRQILLKNLKLQWEQMYSPEQWREFGKEVNSTHVLRGTYVVQADAIQVQLTLSSVLTMKDLAVQEFVIARAAVPGNELSYELNELLWAVAFLAPVKGIPKTMVDGFIAELHQTLASIGLRQNSFFLLPRKQKIPFVNPRKNEKQLLNQLSKLGINASAKAVVMGGILPNETGPGWNLCVRQVNTERKEFLYKEDKWTDEQETIRGWAAYFGNRLCGKEASIPTTAPIQEYDVSRMAKSRGASATTSTDTRITIANGKASKTTSLAAKATPPPSFTKEPTKAKAKPAPKDTAVRAAPAKKKKPTPPRQGLPKTLMGNDGVKMVLVPAGEFVMGCRNNQGRDDEYPPHRIYVDAFYIDEHEVTQKAYREVIGGNPSIFRDTLTERPVENVSWRWAKEYCNRVGKDLPTEAEWEKACKARTNTVYYWGNRIDRDQLWYEGNSRRGTKPVKTRPANGYGIYDMLGNVWEWCIDYYDPRYYSKPGNYENPQGPDDGFFKVLRGGAWNNHDQIVRSSFRFRQPPKTASSFIGFRCVKRMKLVKPVIERVGDASEIGR